MMNGYKLFLLKDLLRRFGDERVNSLISNFSCPKNPDIEKFLREKAIIFEKQLWSSTYLIFTDDDEETKLLAYFTLLLKSIVIDGPSGGSKTPASGVGALSRGSIKLLYNYGTHDKTTNRYTISLPLIAQLSKNFSNGYDNLITGDDILNIACGKAWELQRQLSGQFVFIECEDNQKLKDFYTSNSFVEVRRRYIKPEESDKYLIQMIRFLKDFNKH